MRIVYGIHGYGQGHATRALAVLADLVRKYEVLILAGGDAYEAVHREYPVLRIPTFGYRYRANGTRSNWLTLKENFPGLLDLWLKGPAYQMIEDAVRDFNPDVAISDAEPWTHRIAARLGIFRVGFDHFGIMAYCRPPLRWLDRILAYRDAFAYRRLMGQPERVIVSSFYEAAPVRPGVHMVSALLRPAVFEHEPTNGSHLLAYFNKGEHLFSKRIERALRRSKQPVIVYGTKRLGPDGNLEFRPRGNRAFLEALASCRAVVSTAGNQLVGEALHFGKPLLVIPEDCVEQRMNALAIERLGVGVQASQGGVSARTIRKFLRKETLYRENARRLSRDGRKETLVVIGKILAERDQSDNLQESVSVA